MYCHLRDTRCVCTRGLKQAHCSPTNVSLARHTLQNEHVKDPRAGRRQNTSTCITFRMVPTSVKNAATENESAATARISFKVNWTRGYQALYRSTRARPCPGKQGSGSLLKKSRWPFSLRSNGRMPCSIQPELDLIRLPDEVKLLEAIV